ncbi:AMP-binding protein [Jidongwangia harbinensis]|uniref:AMP-binding protein n=1 Tax=Jidongwangia harbinensis TaxID=2878561 RepID=UPI001CDA1C50|nr:AMP-binding protein [Jidongwangia harbinensis]MCA2211332.1 AMP-binding protein [Jidongwangia harbinensis]
MAPSTVDIVPDDYRRALRAGTGHDPDSVLLFLDDGTDVTRRRIGALADDCRTLLRDHGVASGDVVVLEFDGRAWPLFVGAYLGCHLAGVVPALVTAGGGDDRRQALLDRLPVRCLVRGHPGGSGYQVAEVSPPDRARPAGDVLEYLVSSGTTGEPAVVAVTAAARMAATGRPGGEPRGPVALTAPPGTTAAHTALVDALLGRSGGLACCTTWSPSGFAALAERAGAGAVLLAPALAAQLLALPEADLRRLRGVRVLRLGMAPAAADLVEDVADRLPWLTVLNVYTTSEAWPAGTVMRYGRDDPRSVGRALAGTRIRILGADGRPVPAGTPGAIQLAYAPDGPVTRWVDTADVGRLEADGTLVFERRDADLVSAGGAVVSLAAVEMAALASGLAVDAGAAVVERAPGDRLAVAVVWRGEARDEELRRHLRDRLGAAATPAVVLGVAEVPRDGQGKLRRADIARRAEDLVRAAPATGEDPVAGTVREIWTELLGRPAIGPDDDFFALGADSLLTVLCNSLVEERLGVMLPLSVHYDRPRFAEFTEAVRASRP